MTNASERQKVWMVYHNPDLKKWEVLTWEGAVNNQIIHDHKFDKRYGIVNRWEDPPEFYMAYSDDEGKTWKNHEIERAILTCKMKNRKLNGNAQLLISKDLNRRNNLPSVAVLLQWARTPTIEMPEHMSKFDFSGLCGSLREVPVKVK